MKALALLLAFGIATGYALPFGDDYIEASYREMTENENDVPNLKKGYFETSLDKLKDMEKNFDPEAFHSGPEHADQDQRPRNRAEDEEQGEEGESGEGEEGEENEERLQDDRPGAVEENSSLQALDDFDSEDGEEGEESGEEESEEEGEEEEEEEGEDDDDHGYNLKGYEKDERGGKKIITLDAPDDSITYQRKLRLRFIGRLSHAEPKHTHADSLARKHRIIPRGNLHLRSLGSKGLADEHKRRLNQRKRTGSRIGG